MASHGLIAAGSPHTAGAGAEILSAGGNAVDAIVAAALATPICEPGLASAGGGGILHYAAADAAAPVLCDFFANGPGLGGQRPVELDFVASDLDFGPTRQRFHIGRASAAVPGFLPGLLSAWERWGSLPLIEVVAPACRLARDGVPLDAMQAYACQLHGAMLTHSDSVRAIFAPAGELIGEGDLSRNPRMADTLEALTREDWRRCYDEVVGRAILADFGVERGGLIDESDLSHFEPLFRAPLTVRYRGSDLFLNPPPAAGGQLVALCLELLSSLDLGAGRWGEIDHRRALIAAMRVLDETRGHRGSALAPDSLSSWRRRFADLLAGAGSPPLAPPGGGPGHTTHVSVVDVAGNAAAVTVSYGQGAGHAIGDTGIAMNNLMGEQDLHPGGFHTWPAGTRLATNMCPTVVREPSGRVTVLGSGGSNRIRTAIAQVLVNLLDFALTATEATGRSRLHWEGGVLNVELPGWRSEPVDFEQLLLAGEELIPFVEQNLFFGGVHLAQWSADGGLEGAGDPRRAGVVVVA